MINGWVPIQTWAYHRRKTSTTCGPVFPANERKFDITYLANWSPHWEGLAHVFHQDHSFGWRFTCFTPNAIGKLPKNRKSMEMAPLSASQNVFSKPPIFGCFPPPQVTTLWTRSVARPGSRQFIAATRVAFCYQNRWDLCELPPLYEIS